MRFCLAHGSHTEWQEAWRREAGRAADPGRSQQSMAIVLLLPLSSGHFTASQPSVLLAVLFPREIPKKDQLLGSAGSLSRTPW